MGIGERNSLPQWLTNLIKAKARQLVGKHRFSRFDVGDIEQDILCEVVQRRQRVDAFRGDHPGFLICLVNHAVASIIERRTAAARDYRREDGSLDRWTLDAGRWVRQVDTVTEDATDRRTGQVSQDRQVRCELELDVAAVIAGLPPNLQEVCRHLMTRQGVTEAADAAGLHRSSVYDAIGQIREHFRAAGLDFYCGDPTVRRCRR
ncbi:MAG: hypothetical protein BIFFINMI_02827 [Phycisphaerae bacterium]|nr:hypothetical protein [Phycisphaerae bacterium]